MSILEVRNLTHSYSENSNSINVAVNDVTFSIEKGEIIGVIGHTGSGKSTLVQHLNGLLKPTDGTVLFDDEDIWKNPKEIRKLRSKVGLVFQYPEYQLFEETVYKDIAFGPKNMGKSDSEIESVVNEISKIVGIKPEYLGKSPFDLSGGEKRRVAIAGVMAMKPQVIIFDEPTAGLDPKGRENVIDIIHNYRKATGATVIIISHSMEDMANLADKILVLNDGRLEMFDTVENVFSKAEKLKECGLNVPIVTQVLSLVKSRGVSLPEMKYTVEDTVKMLVGLKGGDRNA